MYKRAQGVSCNGTILELQGCEKQNKFRIDSTLRVGIKSTDKIDIDVNHKSMLLIPVAPVHSLIYTTTKITMSLNMKKLMHYRPQIPLLGCDVG